MEYIVSMITTVTQKNMISIPAEVWKKFGIKPGYKLDWLPVEGKEEIRVRVIPDRAELARRLMGACANLNTGGTWSAELDDEREQEG